MITQTHRPQKFSEVAGQDRVIKVLKAIVRNPEKAPHTIILQGDYGCGKCVPAGTRVATTHGYVPIEDLLLTANPGFNVYKDLVHTRYGPEYTSHFYKELNCRVYNLVMDDGSIIRGTAKHRVMSLQDSVDLYRMDSIKVGDTILKWSEVLEFDDDSEYTEEQCYAFGAWLGDGFYSNCFGFSGTKDYVEEISSILGFTGALTKDKRRKNLYTKRALKSDKYCKLLDTNINRHSWDKFIPQDIFNMSVEKRKAFLAGIIDTDGSVSSNRVDITLKSYELVKGLKELLETLGMNSRYTTKELNGEIYHRLIINNNQFREDFGFKKKVFVKDNKNKREILNINPEFIRELELNKVSGDFYRRTLNNIKNTGKVTKRTLMKLYEIGALPDKYEELLVTNYSRVIDIFYTIEDVYDLTVPEDHEFIAQGTVNHNTTNARIFARALNCKNPKGGEPCGECSICKENIESTMFYDEYDSAIIGNVDTLRGLRDTFTYSADTGYKIICLDEAHLISNVAQSALLKVLEETRGRIFFIICTTHVDKIIPTIRSRSLELRINLVNEVDMINNLRNIAQSEGIEISEDILKLIAQRSGGHMRNAHMLLDQYILLGDEFTEAVKPSRDIFLQLLVRAFRGDKEGVSKCIFELQHFSLADLKSDYEDLLLEIIKVTLKVEPPRDKLIEAVSHVFSNGLVKIISTLKSDVVMNSFGSDKQFQAAMYLILSIFGSRRSTVEGMPKPKL